VAETQRIGDYLIQRLQALGVNHVFGVPGDYALGFFDLVENSELQLVNTCDEQGAGFAADAYARLRGLGVVCVTYCVGGLKIANTTAGAFAERSPVVVISGGPGTNERSRDAMLHHMVRTFDTQHLVFQQLTVASTVLSDPDTALLEIDRVLMAALRFKQPVYIELPRDRVLTPARSFHRVWEETDSDPEAVEAAVGEAVERLRGARQPVILAGELLHRFGLQEELFDLLDRTNIPFAATLLSKSVVEEDHPRYLGVYAGGMSRDEVRAYIESSDCLLNLGAQMTDITLGIYTARLTRRNTIIAHPEHVTVGYHRFQDVPLTEFVRGLCGAEIPRRPDDPVPNPVAPAPFDPATGQAVTVQRFFQAINAFIDDRTVVLADPGDALLGGMDLVIGRNQNFISPAYYTSLGFAVPGALGAQCAAPDLRPLVLVGDGAFQMTGVELSTIARYGLNPIVVVLNNRGYGTERPMLDGPFNDVLNWRYSRLPELLGKGVGCEVRTEHELAAALERARADTGTFHLIEVNLDPDDLSPGLRRLTTALAGRIR
jgi:indolepyruvate decarboxylase